MILPIVNYNENVVIGHVRPLGSQENKDLVKFLQIDRNLYYRTKFTRYNLKIISGANTTFKSNVIKAIE